MSGHVNLQDWIGREEILTDSLSVEGAQRLAATLDMNVSDVREGQELPVGWQWIYFNPVAPARELDVDGHIKRGGFLPPVGLPGRMWAAGGVEVISPLLIGQTATKKSTIENVTSKQGKSGALVFVTVAHDYLQDGVFCLSERQDIVYREAPTAAFSDRAVFVPPAADWQETCVANEVLLFRYSAVTFNAHRIHHDLAYVKDVEGYPGLVVHGPLMATQLADFAARMLGKPLKQFSFRAVQPLFAHEAYSLKGHESSGGGKFWIEAEGAQEIMRAEALI